MYSPFFSKPKGIFIFLHFYGLFHTCIGLFNDFRVRERRQMLDVFLKWVRNNSISSQQWDSYFKQILLILIETFSDNDVGEICHLLSLPLSLSLSLSVPLH